MIGRKDKNGPQGDGINEEVAFTLNATDIHALCYEQPLILDDHGGGFMQIYNDGTTGTLRAQTHGHEPIVAVAFKERGGIEGGGKGYLGSEELAFSIQKSSQQNIMQPIRYGGSQQDTIHFENGVCSTLPKGTHDNAQGMTKTMHTVEPIPINTQNIMDRPADKEINRCGSGIGIPGQPANTLGKAHCHGVAHCVEPKKKVLIRRLTPLECERLQGFPDNYTNIPGASDSKRYSALGNSMTVNVMKWIGERIQTVDDMLILQ